MKKLLKNIALVIAFSACIIALITARAQEPETPTLKLEPFYQVKITNDFQLFQFYPVSGTIVLVYVERAVTPQGEINWTIDQIAGPWGNSIGLSDPRLEFDSTYAEEFMITFQYAERLTLWLEDTAPEFEWKGKVIDARPETRTP
jgi:hypothetical protein